MPLSLSNANEDALYAVVKHIFIPHHCRPVARRRILAASHMAWTILKVIIGVSFVSALFTYATVWYVRSSLSENLGVRRRLHIVDSLLILAMAGLYILHPANRTELIVALMMSGLVVVVWLWRGVRFVHKRRTESVTIKTD